VDHPDPPLAGLGENGFGFRCPSQLVEPAHKLLPVSTLTILAQRVPGTGRVPPGKAKLQLGLLLTGLANVEVQCCCSLGLADQPMPQADGPIDLGHVLHGLMQSGAAKQRLTLLTQDRVGWL